MGNFQAFENKMKAAGLGEASIRAFQRNYEALTREETGLIPENSITPVTKIPSLEELHPSGAADASLLARSVVIKLNGGLGTSMGLQGPKSLLTVRDGVSFLDLMVRQIRDLRRKSGAPVHLLLMNSFSTSRETIGHLWKYHSEGLDDPREMELMQNRIPKVDARTLEPVFWPANPDLEWCPPGHGDLYPALVGSGWLDRLLAEGVRYAFVSNSDNLGAVLDPCILGHFEECGAPFLMEVTRRTSSDRKGGHLALRSRDGQMLLRELAQCPEEDLPSFQDIRRHHYFNTNNLWIRLDLLKERLRDCHGSLPLPMIRNLKTVDPRDTSSTPVVQLESAMGAAIECFQGAEAIEVPRSRFAPVKTTADLLALRSDAYEILEDGQVRLAPSRHGVPPIISLSEEYRLVEGIDALREPGLLECAFLRVRGPVHFEPGVVVRGDVVFENSGDSEKSVAAGIYTDTHVKL